MNIENIITYKSIKIKQKNIYNKKKDSQISPETLFLL